MDSEDFGRLRRLLALKRYEQPPPGYFNDFPSRVIARLEAARSADAVSWFERLRQAFELEPVLTGSFGVAAFGLLLFGLVIFERLEDTSAGSLASGSRATIPSANGDVAVNQFPTGEILQSSIDPAINTQPPNALFDGFQLNVQRASDSYRGN
jgi:hypothetical protein